MMETTCRYCKYRFIAVGDGRTQCTHPSMWGKLVDLDGSCGLWKKGEVKE